MFFLIGAVFGVGMAATILVGQAMGAKDPALAKRVIGTSATFFFCVSLAIAFAGMPLSRHILVWMSTLAESLALADAYLRIILMCVPLLNRFALLSAIVRGSGEHRMPLVLLMRAVVLEHVVHSMLIFGIDTF